MPHLWWQTYKRRTRACGKRKNGVSRRLQAIVRYYECSKCGRDFEIYDPTKEKRESDYKEYWNK